MWCVVLRSLPRRGSVFSETPAIRLTLYSTIRSLASRTHRANYSVCYTYEEIPVPRSESYHMNAYHPAQMPPRGAKPESSIMNGCKLWDAKPEAHSDANQRAKEQSSRDGGRVRRLLHRLDLGDKYAPSCSSLLSSF